MSSALKMAAWILAIDLFMLGCNAENLQPLNSGEFAAPPQTVSIDIMNYAPASGDSFKDLFVSNFSVNASQGQLSLATARDGISDTLKQQLAPTYGFVPGPSAYSVNPGFSDFLLYLMGVTESQETLLNCAGNLMQSSSNDAFIFDDTRPGGSPQAFLGLRDCEKQYLGLNDQLWDNSGTGIPDYLKIRCGMNPQDTKDAQIDAAADGVTNYDKCKEHIPLDESSTSQPNQLFAYKYDFDIRSDGTANFTISNIPILNGGQDNLVAFYLTEVNMSTKAESLYTAFAILNGSSSGATLKFNYWATDPTKEFNQEIAPQ